MDDSRVPAFNLSSVGVRDIDPESASLFLAVCRESGSIEIFELKGSELEPVWSCYANSGYGVPLLKHTSSRTQPSRNDTKVRLEDEWEKFYKAEMLALEQCKAQANTHKEVIKTTEAQSRENGQQN